jgi:DNA polymerase-3 subunit alpha
LFDAAAPPSENRSQDTYPEVEEWDRNQLLAMEKQALGCYVTGHPLQRYAGKLGRLGATETTKLSGLPPWSVVSVAGVVEGYQEKFFRTGQGGAKAGFFEIEDMAGRVKAKLRGDRVEALAPLLTSGAPVFVSGKISFPISDEPVDEPEPTLFVDEVKLLSETAQSSARGICIRLSAEKTGQRQLQSLRGLLVQHSGACPVELVLKMDDGAQAIMSLESLKVEPNDSMLASLEKLFGDCVAELR